MKENNERSNTYFVKGVMMLWKLLGDQKNNVIKLVLIILCTEAVFLMIPYTIKTIIDFLPVVINDGVNDKFILLLSVVVCAPIVGLFLRHRLQEPLFMSSLITLENRWPVLAQEKLLKLHQGYHESENTGKKVAKVNKGCDRLVNIMVNILDMVVSRVFFLIVNFMIMLTISPLLTAIFFIPFIPTAIIIKRIYDKRVPLWDEWPSKNERANGMLCQSIINVSTVQGFVQEKYEQDSMYELRDSMRKLDLNIHLSMAKEMFFVTLILHGAFAASLITGIWLVISGDTSVGTLAYLVATGGTSMYCLQDIVRVYSRMMKDIVEAYRLDTLFNTEVEVQNNSSDMAQAMPESSFVFEDVHFRYTGDNILDKLNLKISQGEMVALVGRSGCGKSTIIRLLARVYDVSGGSIRLDGVDIRENNRDSYRRLFATVQQDVDIFDASLRENIYYSFTGAPETQVLEAVNVAHLECILNDKRKFPDGLDTQVGERGVRLSGGEKQRVGIARAYLALLNGAKVLILDEATSSLDSEAERAIQEMIGKLRREMNISIVAIAHRLSTIEKADKICVVGDGKILEEGDHDRLVARNGLYAKLVRLQKLGELRE